MGLAGGVFLPGLLVWALAIGGISAGVARHSSFKTPKGYPGITLRPDCLSYPDAETTVLKEFDRESKP